MMDHIIPGVGGGIIMINGEEAFLLAVRLASSLIALPTLWRTASGGQCVCLLCNPNGMCDRER